MGLKRYTLDGDISLQYHPRNPDWFMLGTSIQPGYSGGLIIAIRDGEYEIIGLVNATFARSSFDIFMDALSSYGIGIKINPIMEMVNEYFENLEKPAS